MVGGDYPEGRDRAYSNLSDTGGGLVHGNHRVLAEHGDTGYESKHHGNGYGGYGGGYEDDLGRIRRAGSGGDQDDELGGTVRQHSYDFNAMGMHIQVLAVAIRVVVVVVEVLVVVVVAVVVVVVVINQPLIHPSTTIYTSKYGYFKNDSNKYSLCVCILSHYIFTPNISSFISFLLPLQQFHANHCNPLHHSTTTIAARVI